VTATPDGHRPDRLMASNAELRTRGTRNLVDAALAAAARRIVVQSIGWCYEPGDEPAGETTSLDVCAGDPTRRITVDAVRAMEAAATEVPEWVALRNGLLYGPDTWYAPGGRTADAARQGQLAADLDLTSFVHVDDAAAAAVQALTWPTGAVNIVDDEPARSRDWAPVSCSAIRAPEPSSTAQRHKLGPRSQQRDGSASRVGARGSNVARPVRCRRSIARSAADHRGRTRSAPPRVNEWTGQVACPH
jgi:nucleoside-diphosphate-sugar epimerase